MRAEDLGKVSDVGAFFVQARVTTCRNEGRGYTERVRTDLIAASAKNRDPRGQLVQTRMLAAVESLIEQQELPLDRRVAP